MGRIPKPSNSCELAAGYQHLAYPPQAKRQARNSYIEIEFSKPPKTQAMRHTSVEVDVSH
jgi:hypothetical protein